MKQEELNITIEKMLRLTESLNRAMVAIEKSPDFLTRERIAVIKALNHERVETMKDIDRQRLASLEWLTRERISALAVLEKERIATLEHFELIGDRTSEKIIIETKQLIDHFYLRAAQLSGVIFLMILLTIGIVLQAQKRA